VPRAVKYIRKFRGNFKTKIIYADAVEWYIYMDVFEKTEAVKMKRMILAAVFAVSACFPVSASYGTFGDYLLIDSYPAARVMGKAVSAACYGIVFSGENPAALADLENTAFSAMHGFWKMGINLNKAGAAHKFDFGVLGAEITEYGLGSLSVIDMDSFGNPVITGNAEELYAAMFKAVYAADFESFSFGIALKSLIEKFDGDFTHQGVDAGGIIRGVFAEDLNIGLSVLNISTVKAGYTLPLSVNGAVVYDYKDENRSIFFAGAGAGWLVYDRYFEFSAGFSYSPVSVFNIGGGMVFDEDMNVSFSAGAGINYGDVFLDYVFMPDAVLGDTHKISVSGVMGTEKKQGTEEGESKFESYMKSGDYYYRDKKYSNAVKYYEYINVLYWRNLEKFTDSEKSAFFQKLGISYYNIRENGRAREYFERAYFYDRNNEILKHWINLLK